MYSVSLRNSMPDKLRDPCGGRHSVHVTLVGAMWLISATS
jgi:hypothetical protein